MHAPGSHFHPGIQKLKFKMYEGYTHTSLMPQAWLGT